MLNLPILQDAVVRLAYRHLAQYKRVFFARRNFLESFAYKVTNGDPTWITFRDRHFKGMARLALRIGLTPNAVSLLGMVFAALAGFFAHEPSLLMVLLMLNLACDGLDGVMARSSGQSSDFGSIFDITCDTLSLIFVGLGLFAYGMLSWYILAIYVVVVVAYTMRSAVKNKILASLFLSVGSRVLAFVGVIAIALLQALYVNGAPSREWFDGLFAIMALALSLSYCVDAVLTRRRT